MAETHEDFLSLNDEQKLHYLELRLLDIILCMDSTSHTVGQMTEMYNQYLWVIGGASIGDVGYAAQTDGILLALRQQAAEVGYIRKKAEALVAKCKESRNLVRANFLFPGEARVKGEQPTDVKTSQTSRFLELQTALALKKIQTDTQQESKSMHDLTKKGHSDSKSLKVLSIITLVYLPATIIMVSRRSSMAPLNGALTLADDLKELLFYPVCPVR